MNEQVSCLIDAELDDPICIAVLDRLRDDGELRETWATYHLIGDALRGTRSVGVSRLSFAQRLEAEPTVLAPATLDVPYARPSPRHDRARNALSVAAGLSAIAFVAWMAVPTFMPVQTASDEKSAVSSSVASAGDSATKVPEARGVEDYLLAHQRFSPTFAIQGAVPYVRMVSEEGKEVHR